MRIISTLRTLLDDRLLVMLVPALCILSTDMAVMFSLGYAVAIVVAITAVAHSIRRLLFPYLSIGKLLNEAIKTPMSAAIVAVAMFCFMAMMVYSMVAWIQAAAGHVA